MQYFLFIFLFTSICVKAQKKGTSQLYLGTARQQYFDKGGVKNDNILPNDNIRPNNPFAQNYSLEYRRTTRSGWIYGGGLQTGKRKYDVGIYYDLANFDPRAKVSLANAIYQRRIIAKVRYWEPRFFTGYRYPLNSKWAIIAMGGLSFRIFTSGEEERNRTKIIEYKLDNMNATWTTDLIQDDYFFGSFPAKFGSPGARFLGAIASYNIYTSADFYFGIQRKLNYNWLKTIEFGFEIDRRVTSKSRKSSEHASTKSPEMRVYLKPEYSIKDETLFSKDKFYDRNVSLGIRLSLGLWK
jgi:hypothetical protein